MISMPLMTIENIKSGRYSASAFEYQSKIYVGSHGVPPGFGGAFEASSEPQLWDDIKVNGWTAQNQRDAWILTLPSGARNIVLWYPGIGNDELEANFAAAVARMTKYSGGDAWWTSRINFGEKDRDGKVTYMRLFCEVYVVESSLYYLARVDGEPYRFSSIAAAQKWIDINLQRDAQNRPKKGAALKRKLDGMSKYFKKTGGSLQRAATRPFVDEWKRDAVIGALKLELEEIQRRERLEMNGQF